MQKPTAQSLKAVAQQSVNNALCELDNVAAILGRPCKNPEALREVLADLADVKDRLEALRQKL